MEVPTHEHERPSWWRGQMKPDTIPPKLLERLPAQDQVRMARGEREKAAMVQELVAKGEYDDALCLLDHPERLPTLYAWWREGLVREELPKLFAFVWSDTEAAAYYAPEALEMFAAAGYVTDTEERLSGELTIYRGVCGDGEAAGMSWTRELKVARFFAQRFDWLGNPRVYRATVRAEDVLGYFEYRKEAEIVVRPSQLRNVALIEKT